jgi:hypothetical protein
MGTKCQEWITTVKFPALESFSRCIVPNLRVAIKQGAVLVEKLSIKQNLGYVNIDMTLGHIGDLDVDQPARMKGQVE